MDWTYILMGLLTVAGFAGGWFAGSYFIRKEIAVLERQIQRLEGYNEKWFHESVQQYDLSHKISTSQNTNLTTTIKNIVHILEVTQLANKERMKQDEKEKISKLIEQANQIIPSTNENNNPISPEHFF